MLLSLKDEPFRYPEAKHGRGELRHAQRCPRASCSGDAGRTRRAGLAPGSEARPGSHETCRPVHQGERLGEALPSPSEDRRSSAPPTPPDHRIELEAAAKTSGWPKDLLMMFANTVPDLRKLTGGSAPSALVCGTPARAGPSSAGIWTRADRPLFRVHTGHALSSPGDGGVRFDRVSRNARMHVRNQR